MSELPLRIRYLQSVWWAAVMLAGCAAHEATSPPLAPSGAVTKDATDPNANAAIAAAVPSTDIFLLELAPLLRGEAPTSAKAVTDRRGYDNQPAFSRNGRYLWYSSIRDGVQADVFRYAIDTGVTKQMTATPQSEYSPTPLPGGGFSVVQVALDGTQRLWRYDASGRPDGPIRGDITGVGYHAWLGPERLALYLVGEPQRLILASRTTQESMMVTVAPGRALHQIGRSRLAYVSKAQVPWSLHVFNPETGRHQRRASLFPDVEDIAWLSDDSALTARGRSVYRLAPDATEWTELASLARVVPGDISRMSVDPGGRWLALVSSRSEATH